MWRHGVTAALVLVAMALAEWLTGNPFLGTLCFTAIYIFIVALSGINVNDGGFRDVSSYRMFAKMRLLSTAAMELSALMMFCHVVLTFFEVPILWRYALMLGWILLLYGIGALYARVVARRWKGQSLFEFVMGAVVWVVGDILMLRADGLWGNLGWSGVWAPRQLRDTPAQLGGDADAVFAVYPFTPQPSISDAIIKYSSRPVFCGIGGGLIYGARCISLAISAENQGAMGVVMNAPTTNRNLRMVAKAIDIPVVVTVPNDEVDIRARIEAGASIVNVAGGKDTMTIVRKIRDKFPDLPIIATGGHTTESLHETIKAGANAITFTPPSIQEMFSQVMDHYREETVVNDDYDQFTPEQREIIRHIKAKIGYP